MREHSFRNETSELFRDLRSNHSRRDELTVAVYAVDGYPRVSLFANDFCAPVVQLNENTIQVRVAIVSELFQPALPPSLELSAKLRPVLNLRRHAPRTLRGGHLGSFDQLIADPDGYLQALDLALTKAP